MERPVRIGLAGSGDRDLEAAVRDLPTRPEVRRFADVYGDIEALIAFRPELLLVEAPPPGVETAALQGALRLLRPLLDAAPVLLAAPPAREVELAPICAATGALVLLLPLQPGSLATAVDRALAGGGRPREEVFLDLARGIADEINNPLQFLMGHLQLLQALLDPASAGDQRDQVQSALAGAVRIEATVERVRLLAQAAAGPRALAPIDLRATVKQSLERAGSPAPAVLGEPEDGDFTVAGDRDLLRPALDLLAGAALELHGLHGPVHFALWRLDGAVRLRLVLPADGLDDWRLPRTFEPYYLNRLLRGSSHGLSLFAVQAAVHGHGGQATARRLPDGAIAIDLQLPIGG